MRRTHRRRRAAALASVAIVVCVAAGAWTSFGGGNQRRVPVDRSLAPKVAVPPKTAVVKSNHIAMPKFVRGVHISLGIAASKTKMNQFINLTSKGLNTLEIDVKDENGEVGYTVGAPALARKIGATRSYYDAKQLIADAHAAGIYVIGRIVCFEDPILSNKLPSHAIRTTSGGVWKNASGLGWTNEYDPFVWNYLMNLSKSAANMGFDEIQYDYVRFPTDGDTSTAVWPHKVAEPYNQTIYRFLKRARATVKPMGVNISANVFGLSAHENLNIGQSPTKIAPLLDAISPMAYPSHYGKGEYNLSEPRRHAGRDRHVHDGRLPGGPAFDEHGDPPMAAGLQPRAHLHPRGRRGADQRRRARRGQGLAALERRRRVPQRRARSLAHRTRSS